MYMYLRACYNIAKLVPKSTNEYRHDSIQETLFAFTLLTPFCNILFYLSYLPLFLSSIFLSVSRAVVCAFVFF